jgi:hypothetical protein
VFYLCGGGARLLASCNQFRLRLNGFPDSFVVLTFWKSSIRCSYSRYYIPPLADVPRLLLLPARGRSPLAAVAARGPSMARPPRPSRPTAPADASIAPALGMGAMPVEPARLLSSAASDAPALNLALSPPQPT